MEISPGDPPRIISEAKQGIAQEVYNKYLSKFHVCDTGNSCRSFTINLLGFLREILSREDIEGIPDLSPIGNIYETSGKLFKKIR